MPSTQTKEDVPSWMQEEETRATKQKGEGTTVNNKATPPAKRAASSPPKKAPVERVERVAKGFQLSKDRALAWDRLVAALKHSVGKKGPELADEAVDLLIEKYKDNLKNLKT